ncbi:MAG: hypothetical protein NUV51_04405 [Sulfuricaulis sp.]|nr:hypothetical protein [Sulfuricaulis sp.]
MSDPNCSADTHATLAQRIAELIEAQHAMTAAIGQLAQSVAMLAQSACDEEMPEGEGGTLDD